MTTTEAEPRALDLVLDRLTELPEMLRQTLTDHLWGLIPVHISEKLSLPTLNAGTAANIPRQTDGLELITSITVAVPTGATGLLQLGAAADHTIPFPAGITNLTDLKIILASSDVRSLTLTGGNGRVYVLLSGEQLPTSGTLAP